MGVQVSITADFSKPEDFAAFMSAWAAAQPAVSAPAAPVTLSPAPGLEHAEPSTPDPVDANVAALRSTAAKMAEEPEAPAASAGRRGRPKKEEATPAKAVVKPAPVVEPEPVDEDEQDAIGEEAEYASADTEEAPAAPAAKSTYTIADLQKHVAAAAKRVKPRSILGLLSEYGVKRVTDLPESKFAPFVTSLEQLAA